MGLRRQQNSIIKQEGRKTKGQGKKSGGKLSRFFCCVNVKPTIVVVHNAHLNQVQTTLAGQTNCSAKTLLTLWNESPILPPQQW